MPRPLARVITILIALATAYRPVAAIPDAAPVLDAAPMTAAAPVVVIALDAQQMHVAERLVQLGEEPLVAMEAAALLTADDLAVLMANPGMLQRGGGSSVLTRTVVIWILIIAGVVALAIAAGNGFIVQN